MKLSIKISITVVLIALNYNLFADVSNECSKNNPEVILAAAEVVGLNLGIWSVDRYIGQVDWAKISIKSVRHNLKSGFHFDDSQFLMNQFLHPYHGSMYFNSARCNGMNFWQSTPYALGGSLMWELFMEIEEPSINDLLTTTLGGIMMGEIQHRFSSLVLDDDSSGAERTWREIGAGLIDPMRGLNRLFSGKTNRLKQCIDYEYQPLIAEVSLGSNTVGDGLDLINGKRSPLLKIQLVYGSPFLKDKRKPFDYFNLHLGLNLKGNETITNFYGEALIWGKNLNFQGNDSDLEQDNLIGAFQHLDYLANDVYKIAASGVGAGIISRFEALEGMNLFTSCHLSAIVMGGSNSAYASQADRDYNLGSGFSTKFEGWLINDKYGEIYMGYLRYWLYTISGASGQESITITNGKVMIPIYQNLKLGAEYLYYHRDGLYSDYPDVTADNNEFRTFISCRF